MSVKGRSWNPSFVADVVYGNFIETFDCAIKTIAKDNDVYFAYHNHDPEFQIIDGKISKRETNQFAFIKKGNVQCYIRPETVQKQQLKDNDNVSVLAVLDYNKKKECWDAGDVMVVGATKLTADSWSSVVDDVYNQPTKKRPYYYVHNQNLIDVDASGDLGDNTELPTNAETDQLHTLHFMESSSTKTDYTFAKKVLNVISKTNPSKEPITIACILITFFMLNLCEKKEKIRSTPSCVKKFISTKRPKRE